MDHNKQAAKPAQPIRDISPPADNILGNPTQFPSVPVEAAPGTAAAHSGNPIAGGKPQPSHQSPEPPKTDDLEKVLKDVNKDVKATIQKPRNLSRPTLVIIAAIIIGIALMATAFYAFSKPN